MLTIGDTVEVLEPEDRDNYRNMPDAWNKFMDNYVGHKLKIVRAYLGHKDKPSYILSGNEWVWDESNLKLISRSEHNPIIGLNDRVIVMQGKHKGKTDTVNYIYDRNGQIYYGLQDSSYLILSNHVKPLSHEIGLF